MNSKRKIKVLSIFFTAILLLGLLLFALRPLHYQERVSVCTLEGDVLEVELDVTLRRHLWKPIESHGKIIIDGVEYVNINDLYPQSSIKTQTSIHIFQIPSRYALDRGDPIVLNPAGNWLDQFMLSVVRSGVTATYFGPAASQAEAWEVAESWMD